MRYSLVLAIILWLLVSCSNQRKPLENLPKSLPIFDVKIRKGNVFDGYIFLRKGVSPGAQLMIDENGNVVWHLLADTTLFRPFTPYKDAFVALHSPKDAYEITYKKDTVNRWIYNEEAGFNRPLHHEIIRDKSGNLVALTKDYFLLNSSGADTINVDGVVKLSPEGDKLWSWSLNELLDTYNEPERARKQMDGHANGLAIDMDGDYLISWRNFSQIWKISSKDGSLIWKFGGDSAYDSIHGQHAISKNLYGDYMVFDNGDVKRRAISRAFGFKVEPSGSFTSTLTIDLPDSLFSFKQGSVYQFAEDRYLFCSPGAKSLIVTDRTGDILWLATSDHGYYRAYYLPPEVLR